MPWQFDAIFVCRNSPEKWNKLDWYIKKGKKHFSSGLHISIPIFIPVNKPKNMAVGKIEWREDTIVGY